MQSILAKQNEPRSALWGVAAATLLLVGAQAVRGQGASPVGFWDVVESGVRSGVAAMHFTNDFTFSLDEIVVPKQPNNSSPTVGRGGEDISRTGLGGGGNTNSLPPHTNIFGAIAFPKPDFTNVVPQVLVQVTTNLDTNNNLNTILITNTFNYGTTNIFFDGVPAGQWGYNTQGKLIGFLTELSGVDAFVTNVVPSITNDYGFFNNLIAVTNVTISNSIPTTNVVITNLLVHLTNIVYTTNITVDRLTNAISFTGIVVPGSRLTLNLQTPAGTVIFRGVPPAPLTDVTGQWYGRKKNQNLTFYEFFTLTNTSSLLNTYRLQGSGPGYVFGPYIFQDARYGDGELIISRQKRFGFAANVFTLGELPQAPVVVRAATGPINVSRRTFTAQKAIEGTGSSDDIRFNYNASKKP